jgi:hypothetical protein
MISKYLKLLGVIIVVFAFYLLLKSIGVFSSYNYFTAYRDFRRGLYQIVLMNEDPDIVSHEQWLAKNYNYKVINLSYFFMNSNKYITINGISSYNSVMNSAIKKRMNPLLRKLYNRDCDSIYNLINKYPRL